MSEFSESNSFNKDMKTSQIKCHTQNVFLHQFLALFMNDYQKCYIALICNKLMLKKLFLFLFTKCVYVCVCFLLFCFACCVSIAMLILHWNICKENAAQQFICPSRLFSLQPHKLAVSTFLPQTLQLPHPTPAKQKN